MITPPVLWCVNSVVVTVDTLYFFRLNVMLSKKESNLDDIIKRAARDCMKITGVVKVIHFVKKRKPSPEVLMLSLNPRLDLETATPSPQHVKII